MPTIDTDAAFGLTDRRLGRGSTDSPLADATEANYLDQAALDAALTATIGAANLSRMTKNDKVYAYRKLVDSAGMFR
jgi:hypothetical protein